MEIALIDGHVGGGSFQAIRRQLVTVALQWQEFYGVAPFITSALSEVDAAAIVGMSDAEYRANCANRTAVTRGYDFLHQGFRYQVKANRPSGRPGSPVTLVGNANNYEWDRLIWILYDKYYVVQEAWEWEVEKYRQQFETATRLSPKDMRRGRVLFRL